MLSQRIEVCLSFLAHKNPKLRKEAAELLGQIQDDYCLACLKKAFESEPDATVRHAILGSIVQIESQNCERKWVQSIKIGATPSSQPASIGY